MKIFDMYATYSYYLHALISDKKKRWGVVIKSFSKNQLLKIWILMPSHLFVFVKSTGHQKGVQFFICSLELFVFS